MAVGPAWPAALHGVANVIVGAGDLIQDQASLAVRLVDVVHFQL
jgi:hypothetical protein